MSRRKSQDEYWISFSDMMTALMVIFMFIAINYIIQIIEYKFVEQNIYNALQLNLKKELESETLELSPDGTVRFNFKESNQELFSSGGKVMSGEFKKKLDLFTPKYLNIITEKNYLDNITEIRIEGHTDRDPLANSKRDSYDYNLELSSNRARDVLNYIRNHKSYIKQPDSIKKRLDFLFTANGMSFSRALNDKKEIIYLSENKNVNKKFSRRVEFKIVTSNKDLVEKIVKRKEK